MIVLPCHRVFRQGAVELQRLRLIFKASGCVVKLYLLRRGRALRSDPGPMTRGWLRRNRWRETLCGLPDGLAGRGFRVFTSIPMVRLRRERPLDHESRRRRAFFARLPYRFCFCFCHLPSTVPPVLVRQLRGPHLSTCP